jgi:uncharacterized protein (TIGR03067 family)
MRRIVPLIVAVGWLAGADGPKNERAAKDIEALQGNWTMISLEINGEDVSKEQVQSAKLVVKGDRYAPVFDDRIYSETFTVDPDKSPKAIDFTYTDGPRKGETVKGIYKLEGDTYTMCRAIKAEDERPKTFATGRDSGLALVVWKRSKPSKEEKDAAPR